jgi:virginiamycin B lyase
LVCGAALCIGQALAGEMPAGSNRAIGELTPTAKIHLGKTADWVAITSDSVWVGATGPNAVHQIDPETNTVVATILMPGNPCAGLAVGFGSLWVPLCAKPNTLARVDLHTHQITLVPGVGPAAPEGGIALSQDSVWLVINASASLARIDPSSGRVRQKIRVPPGSYNPLYSDGQIWLTRAEGAEVTVINADKGAIVATVHGGPRPRFLTVGAGSIWTLNQGDGSLTRIDTRTRRVAINIPLGTPGHGGDISFGDGMVWTSFDKIPLTAVDAASGALLCRWAGPGGDSLHPP